MTAPSSIGAISQVQCWDWFNIRYPLTAAGGCKVLVACIANADNPTATHAEKPLEPNAQPTRQPLSAATKWPPMTHLGLAASLFGSVANKTDVLANVIAVAGAPDNDVKAKATPT